MIVLANPQKREIYFDGMTLLVPTIALTFDNDEEFNKTVSDLTKINDRTQFINYVETELTKIGVTENDLFNIKRWAYARFYAFVPTHSEYRNFSAIVDRDVRISKEKGLF